MTAAPQRIEGLDFLRGFASLAVCWFHLTSFNYNTPDPWLYHLLRLTGGHGWLGVEIFFVISGFVIPYSLHRARYEIRHYLNFVLRRIVRLDPPYLAAIGIILLLAFGSAWHSGRMPEVEGESIPLTRVLLHLGYLNIFSSYSWLNPGFWTLAIEIQYYFLMGLLFPLIVNRNQLMRLATLMLMGTISLFSVARYFPVDPPYSSFIPRFFCLFLLGVVTFQFRVGLVRTVEYVPMLVVVAALSYLTVGLSSTLAGLAAVAVILFYPERRTPISSFFARISYSLYLLHWPIGHFTISLLGLKILKAQSDSARFLAFFVSLAVCLASAYVLYVTVEKPAQRWSKRFRYGRT